MNYNDVIEWCRDNVPVWPTPGARIDISYPIGWRWVTIRGHMVLVSIHPGRPVITRREVQLCA